MSQRQSKLEQNVNYRKFTFVIKLFLIKPRRYEQKVLLIMITAVKKVFINKNSIQRTWKYLVYLLRFTCLFIITYEYIINLLLFFYLIITFFVVNSHNTKNKGHLLFAK